MGLFKKKADHITDRAKALNQEIAALEQEIKRLDTQLQRNTGQPRLRTTALPQGTTAVQGNNEEPSPAPLRSPGEEPVFEDVDRARLKVREEPHSAPEYFNELGVRKYDLPAFVARVRNHFRGPSTSNPKLVSYLAAGGIHGLRPMRYEKRVARNRFIALAIFLFLMLLGILAVFFRGS